MSSAWSIKGHNSFENATNTSALFRHAYGMSGLPRGRPHRRPHCPWGSVMPQPFCPVSWRLEPRGAPCCNLGQSLRTGSLQPLVKLGTLQALATAPEMCTAHRQKISAPLRRRHPKCHYWFPGPCHRRTRRPAPPPQVPPSCQVVC